MRVPARAVTENGGDRVPPSTTKKLKEPSSRAPSDEASFQQGTLIAEARTEEFQNVPAGIGSSQFLKKFHYVCLNAFVLVFRCFPMFRGSLLSLSVWL